MNLEEFIESVQQEYQQTAGRDLYSSAEYEKLIEAIVIGLDLDMDDDEAFEITMTWVRHFEKMAMDQIMLGMIFKGLIVPRDMPSDDGNWSAKPHPDIEDQL